MNVRLIDEAVDAETEEQKRLFADPEADGDHALEDVVGDGDEASQMTRVTHAFGVSCCPVAMATTGADEYLQAEQDETANCGDFTTVGMGIDGNTEPWVLGASNVGASPGTNEPATGHFANGELDHLRMSSVRRDFATFAP